MTVRKAVIPAAGLGTRFLPASKALPKEMIPVVDKPGIQYVVEEAVRAGLDDILIVTSRTKGSIADHFDRSIELEGRLEAAGKEELLAEVRRVAELAQVHYVRQKEPLGFGHAVLMAREHVGDEPFAVMVPDEIVPIPEAGEADLMPAMLEIYEQRKASVIVVQEVPHEDISAYGAIDPEFVEEKVARIKDIIEKPEPADAPSDLASRGRYVFGPEIFDALEKTQAGVGGEIQLTDAVKKVADEQGAFAYFFGGVMLDIGKKLEYLAATVELALEDDELGQEFKDYLMKLVAGLG